MTRGLLVVLVLLASVPVGAMTPQELLNGGHVRVRVSAEPANQVVIGQQTRFFVEILTDSWFSKAPSYPDLSIDGAIALMPEHFGSNFSERINGVSYAGQRRSYVIFPQRAGPLLIPSLRIPLGVSEDGKPGQPFTLRTQPLRLNVVLPAEAEGIDGLVATPRLRVHDEWRGLEGGLGVGDAVKRTVRMEADRALGMLLPDLPFAAPSGVSVYEDQPRSLDHVNRGQYRGERIESVTYVLQRSGEFTLPAIELRWWNTETGVLESVTLASRTLEVSGTAPLVTLEGGVTSWHSRLDRALSFAREHRLALLLAASCLVLGVVGVRRLLPLLLALRAFRREQYGGSEAKLFQDLEQSAAQGDIDALVRNFWRWRDRLAVDLPSLTEEMLRRAAETSGFADRWAELEQQRYGGGPSAGVLGSLRPALRALRDAARSASRPRGAASVTAGLNPRGERD